MKTTRLSTRSIWVVVFGLLVSISAAGCRRGEDPWEEPTLATLPWAELGSLRPSILRLSPPLGHRPCVAAIAPRIPSSAAGFEREAPRLPVLTCAPTGRSEGLATEHLLAFHTRLHRASEVWPEGSRLHARGLLSLLTPGQEGALTRAEIRLAEARRLDPGNAATINDLAVAILLQAAEEDRPDRAIEGLVLLEDALRRNPRSVPALYNRAVVLSLFELRTPARSAWRTYLDKDRAGPWSMEAREWLRYLDRPTYEQEWRSTIEPDLREQLDQGDDVRLGDLVARNLQRSREWAERELMRRWAAEVLARRPAEAERLLERMGRVGQALADTTGDRMLLRAVARMRTASPHDLEVLASGHEALAKGFDALYSWRLDDATREQITARRQLELQGDPFAFWATFYLALVDYYGKEYESSLRALEDLGRSLANEPYPVLQGRVLWVQGLIHIARQRLQAALDCYRAALERFQGAGEEQNTAVLHSLVAEAWSKLGNRREGWHHGFAALRGTPKIFMPVRHHAVLEALILNARREQGLEPFALALSEEHVRVAEATGGDEILHNAQMRLGATLQALGREEEALEAYRRAESAAARLDDPRFAARARADRALLRAETMTDSDPAGAKRLLDQAIETYEATGFVYLLPRALDARARAHLAVGDHGSAEKDLERKIELYEATAGDLLEDPLRMSYLGRAHAGFQRMVAFQATTLGRPVKALHYAERGRVRALLNLYTLARLDGLIPAEAGPELAPVSPPRTVLHRLPQATAVLEYAVLDDRVLLWVLRREGIGFFELPSGREALAATIEALHRSIAMEKPGVPRKSAALYDLLIRPGWDALAGTRRLVVVADDRLAGVPFEALFDSRAKRFLVEDFEVSYAPSATLYVQLLEERARRGDSGRIPRVLAVSGAGRTRFDPLPNAEQEALTVARMYPDSTLLRGDRISEEELLVSIGEADVFHFAGHAVPNPSQELASKLILEDSPEALRELHAYELYGHRFERTSLVVLSACDTGRIHGHPGESVAILARPFLASGVPMAVGSLWQVDDRATRSFFELFHRRLADGEDAVTALALTKRRLLRSGGPRPIPPRTWAAFVAIGAP